MRKFFEKSKRSILYRWIISYLCILIVPLLFGILIYEYALHAISDEVDTVQYQSLVRVQDAVENMLDTCEHLGTTIAGSSEAGILKQMTKGNQYTPEQILYTKDLLDKMTQYQAANEIVDGFVVYFPKTGYVLMDSTFCPLEWTENTEQTKYGMSIESVKGLAEQNRSGLFATDQKKLIYSFCTFRGKSDVPDIMVLIYLDMFQARELIEMPESILFMIFSDGDWFSANASELHDNAGKVIKSEDTYLLSENDDYYVMSIKSEEYDIDLINMTPKEIYLHKINFMIRILVVYILLCLAGGGAVTWYLSRKNYRPVQELLELTSGKLKRKDSSIQEDEFSMIRAAYQSLQSDYRDKTEIIRKNKRIEQNNRMNELLVGKGVIQYIEREGEEIWNCRFPYKTFVLVSVDLVDLGEVSLGEQAEVSSEIIDMAYFIVRNVLSELINSKYTSVEAETVGNLFALVNINDEFDKELVIRELKRMCQEMKDFIRENYSMQLQVDISAVRDGYSSIRKCYEDILEIHEYRMFRSVPEEVIMGLCDCEFPDEKEDDSKQSMLRQMNHFLINKEYLNAQKLLIQFQERDNFGTVSIEEKEGNSIEMIVNQVSAYIEENYTDNMLSAGIIADKFDVGISYLSRSFKKLKGIGMLDYINKLRMERAKQLLLEGLSVREVAERVGFFTSQPLVRIFRQWEGVTPSEYRKKMN